MCNGQRSNNKKTSNDDKTLCRKQMTEQHEHKIGNKHETGTCSGYILLFIITQFIADTGKFWKILVIPVL
jgi:hypothetical protein